VLALLVVPTSARAHEAGLSRGIYRVDAAIVTAELSLARAEILALIPGADADADGVLGEFELLAIDAPLRRQLAAGLAVLGGATPCPGAIERVVFVEDDGLRCEARFTCPAAPPLPTVTLRWPLLAHLGPGHRHLAQVVFAAGPGEPEPQPIDVVVHARRSALTFRRPTPGVPDAPQAAAPRSPAQPAATPPAPRVPNVWLWIALASLAAAALGLRAWRREPVIASAIMLDPDIQTLVHMGDLIGAIGLYQQRHGGSTLVARKAIDQASRELSQETTPGSPIPGAPLTIINDSELDAALRAGQKIAAIKRYRELYNVGLKDAKDAVEAMLAGQPVEHPAPAASEPAAQLQAQLQPQLQPELDRLIAAGQKIMAIKHHRTITGQGLKESKDAVEARMLELG